MTNAAMNTPSRRVELLFASTPAQNRLTVAFRIILAIPQIVVLYFLFLAAIVVVVIGWFAALFTGRLPEWVHTFLSGLIRWSTRLGAYLFLLTDAYPPFSFDDVDYPVRPVLPERGDLNRVAVLFRIVLAIPAFFFYQIVQNGLTFPLLLAMWFAVLFTGEMPQSLYPTYMSLLRYQARFNAWFFMVTSEYAWGMMGDTVLVDTGYTPPPFVPPSSAASPPPPPPPPPQSTATTAGTALRIPAVARCAGANSAARCGTRLAAGVAAATAGTNGLSPGGDATPIAVGAHGRLSGRRATTAYCARPTGSGAGLDDLRNRLGLDRLGGSGHPELRTSQAQQHGNGATCHGTRRYVGVHARRRPRAHQPLKVRPLISV